MSMILLSGDTFWIDEARLSNQQPTLRDLSSSLTETLENQEKKIIEAALAESNGKVAGRPNWGGYQTWNSALNPGQKDPAAEHKQTQIHAQTLTYEPTLPKIGQFPESGQYRLLFRGLFQSVAIAGELQLLAPAVGDMDGLLQSTGAETSNLAVPLPRLIFAIARLIVRGEWNQNT